MVSLRVMAWWISMLAPPGYAKMVSTPSRSRACGGAGHNRQKLLNTRCFFLLLCLTAAMHTLTQQMLRALQCHPGASAATTGTKPSMAACCTCQRYARAQQERHCQRQR